MSDDVKIPVPVETDIAYIDEFGSTDTLNYTVKTISRQEYDAKLVKDWYDQHKHADVQVVSQDTKMPLYAIYATPLAYHEEDVKRFFAEIRKIAEEQHWEED
jgi:hypothetical protein